MRMYGKKIMNACFLGVLCMLWGVQTFAAKEEEFKVVDISKMCDGVKTISQDDYNEYYVHAKRSEKKNARSVNTKIRVKGKVYRVRFRYSIEKDTVKIIDNVLYDAGLEEAIVYQVEPLADNVEEVLLCLLDENMEYNFLTFNLKNYRIKDYFKGWGLDGLLSKDIWIQFAPGCKYAYVFYYEYVKKDKFTFYRTIKKECIIDVVNRSVIPFEELLPNRSMGFAHWLDGENLFVTYKPSDANSDYEESGFSYNLKKRTIKRIYTEEDVYYQFLSEQDLEEDFSEVPPYILDLNKGMKDIVHYDEDGPSFHRYCFYVSNEELFLLDKLKGKYKRILSTNSVYKGFYDFGLKDFSDYLVEGIINEEETKALISIRNHLYNGFYVVLGIIDIQKGEVAYLTDKHIDLNKHDVRDYFWNGDDLVIDYIDHTRNDKPTKTLILQLKKSKKGVGESKEGSKNEPAKVDGNTMETPNEQPKDESEEREEVEPKETESREKANSLKSGEAEDGIETSNTNVSSMEADQGKTVNDKKQYGIWIIIVATLGLLVTLWIRKRLDN